jgi:hypothetical protein
MYGRLVALRRQADADEVARRRRVGFFLPGIDKGDPGVGDLPAERGSLEDRSRTVR